MTIPTWLNGVHCRHGPFSYEDSFFNEFLALVVEDANLPFYNDSWNHVQISKILGFASGSKEYFPTLERFFYGHMIWEFGYLKHFVNIIEPHKPCTCPPLRCINPSVSSKLKNLCLILHNWKEFVFLLKYTVETLLKTSSPIPNIRSIEIKGLGWNAKVMNYKGEVIDEKIRVQYLATQCFKLRQRYPNLIIGLSGFSQNGHTEPPETTPEKVFSRSRKESLGYSWTETSDFLRGTFEPMVNIPSIEFLPFGGPKRDLPTDPRPAIQWKMLFAEEWRKILKLGLESNEGVGEVYDAVDKPDRTMDRDDPDERGGRGSEWVAREYGSDEAKEYRSEDSEYKNL